MARSTLWRRGTAAARLSARLGREQLQILLLPAHGVIDSVVAAGMVEEDVLLHRAGMHLAILAQMNRSLRETVGLAAGIQSEHVGFVLGSARVSVEQRRGDESYDRDQQNDQRQHRRVADAADLPPLSPALQAPAQRPAQQPEADHNHDREK